MNIITQIKEFIPRTELQGKSKTEILGQLSQYGDDLYYRESLHGHITASAIILNPALDKILMIYHNIYGSYSWTGGHSDGEQDLYQVAYAEAKEETGVVSLYPVSRSLISLECLPVAAHVKNGSIVETHEHYNVTYGFICSEKDALKIKPDENSDVKWLAIDELDQYCAEKEMMPIYEDNIAYIRQLRGKKEENYRALPTRLLPWYRASARILPWREDQDPYHVWISEIMLQQTRVETVIDYYKRFLAAFPTVKDLAKAEEEKVMKLWEGLGYYSRARNLHKAAKIVVEKYRGKFPESYSELLALPGIGSYTAGAIASISFNLPIAAVDGNVLRIVSRITEDYRCIDDESTKRVVAAELEKVYPLNHCGDFTQSLMELGATVCLPNGAPLCLLCPMQEICMANQNGTQEYLPVRKEKAKRKSQQKTLFLFHAKGKIVLQKRTEKGVLNGLWQLPNVEGHMSERQVTAYMAELGIEGTIKKFQKGKHIFTHIEWDMICYYIECESNFENKIGNTPNPYVWADENALAQEYTIPTAFKKFIDEIIV